jgi:hypothetical protein
MQKERDGCCNESARCECRGPHTKATASRREDAMEDGQKRFKEKRAAEEAGDDAQIWMKDMMAPMRNWQAVSESGPTEAVWNSCLVAMVAATLHTYLPAQEIIK